MQTFPEGNDDGKHHSNCQWSHLKRQYYLSVWLLYRTMKRTKIMTMKRKLTRNLIRCHILLSRTTGSLPGLIMYPQCGQAEARSETAWLHSGQLIRAMLFTPFHIFLGCTPDLSILLNVACILFSKMHSVSIWKHSW